MKKVFTFIICFAFITNLSAQFEIDFIPIANITGTLTQGGYIDVTNGQFVTNADYHYSTFIPVKAGTYIRVSGCFGYNPTLTNFTVGIAGYTGNTEKSFINNVFDPGKAGYTKTGRYRIENFIVRIPEGVNYIRGSSAYKNSKGIERPLFIELVDMSAETKQIVLDATIRSIKKEFANDFKTEVNLTGTLTPGGYIDVTNGQFVTNADYHYTTFIPVTAGTYIKVSGCFGYNPALSNFTVGIAGYTGNTETTFVKNVFDPGKAGYTKTGRYRIENFIVQIPPGVNYIRGSSAYKNSNGQERPLLLESVGSDLISKNIKRISSNGNLIVLYDPYANGIKIPLLGQLHVHTTNSDGVYPPATVAQRMKDAGYDFWTITDHNLITPNPNVNDLIWLCNSYEDTRKTFHSNVFNADAVFNNNNINHLTDHFFHKENGLVMYDHPDWTKLYQSDNFIKNIAKGLSFVEVYNFPGSTQTDRAFDILLSNGHKVWATATDDYHNDSHLKKGWVIAYSESRNPNDIMFALLTGCFVASSGFSIKSVELIGNTIKIGTGNSSAVTTFYKENRTVLATITGNEAKYEITGNEKFVRAVSQDASGKKCWIQPYFILGTENPTAVYSEMLSDIELKIYPNPTDGLLKVEIYNLPEDQKAHILLYNLSGTLISSFNEVSDFVNVNISGQPAGIYLMKIVAGEYQTEWRIIKK